MINIILKISFIILLTISISCNQSANQSESENLTAAKPNVILLYVDDLGYADVGSYGALGVKTPNVDRLASSGINLSD